MNISEKLIDIRTKLGLSQKSISDLLSIKQSTWSNYETGKRKPSVRVSYKLIRLAKLKDIDILLEYLKPDE